MATREDNAEEDVIPYAPYNEARFFFAKGVPLGLSSMLNWGIPPLLGMIFAGHTDNSAHLQASLGYARVWVNCTVLMPCFGLNAYFGNVVPGCVGAGREDRIPRYFHRSVLMNYMIMTPIYVLQFFSGSIMHQLGVPAANCTDIDEYCRWMVVMAILLVPISHLESCFINLGFAKCATFNSFLTGLGVDVVCTYLFILTWQWGVFGAAMAQITVQASRLLVWLALLLYFGLFRKCCVAPPGAEPVFVWPECVLFGKLAVPQMLSFFAGWLVFEFQVIAMANIEGISNDARAAGAAWVQVESSLAATQDGWISSASIRILNLLGKQDPNTWKAFLMFNALAFTIVAISNIPFMVYEEEIAGFVSNDAAVQKWISKMLWVLVPHTLTRVISIICSMLYVPLGRGMLGTLVISIGFYAVGTPISLYTALTNNVTRSVEWKMVACVGLTTIAQAVIFCISAVFLWRLNWHEAGTIINRRANMDKRETVSMVLLETTSAAAGGA